MATIFSRSFVISTLALSLVMTNTRYALGDANVGLNEFDIGGLGSLCLQDSGPVSTPAQPLSPLVQTSASDRALASSVRQAQSSSQQNSAYTAACAALMKKRSLEILASIPSDKDPNRKSLISDDITAAKKNEELKKLAAELSAKLSRSGQIVSADQIQSILEQADITDPSKTDSAQIASVLADHDIRIDASMVSSAQLVASQNSPDSGASAIKNAIFTYSQPGNSEDRLANNFSVENMKAVNTYADYKYVDESNFKPVDNANSLAGSFAEASASDNITGVSRAPASIAQEAPAVVSVPVRQDLSQADVGGTHSAHMGPTSRTGSVDSKLPAGYPSLTGTDAPAGSAANNSAFSVDPNAAPPKASPVDPNLGANTSLPNTMTDDQKAVAASAITMTAAQHAEFQNYVNAGVQPSVAYSMVQDAGSVTSFRAADLKQAETGNPIKSLKAFNEHSGVVDQCVKWKSDEIKGDDEVELKKWLGVAVNQMAEVQHWALNSGDKKFQDTINNLSNTAKEQLNDQCAGFAVNDPQKLKQELDNVLISNRTRDFDVSQLKANPEAGKGTATPSESIRAQACFAVVGGIILQNYAFGSRDTVATTLTIQLKCPNSPIAKYMKDHIGTDSKMAESCELEENHSKTAASIETIARAIHQANMAITNDEARDWAIKLTKDAGLDGSINSSDESSLLKEIKTNSYSTDDMLQPLVTSIKNALKGITAQYCPVTKSSVDDYLKGKGNWKPADLAKNMNITYGIVSTLDTSFRPKEHELTAPEITDQGHIK